MMTIMPRTTILLLVALALLGAPAIAQVTVQATVPVTGSPPPTTPVLKRAVTVTNDVVRIGDLVDNAGPSANVPLFRSPDIGTTGTVAAAQVLEALRSHAMVDVNTNGVDAIEVTRPGRTILKKEIEARIVRALGAQFRSIDTKNIAVFFDRDVQPIYIEPSATADLQLANVLFDPRSGRFDLGIDVPGSAIARRANLHYSGSLIEMVDTAIVTRALARGDVVRASDIAITRKPKSEVKGDTSGSADQLVGLEARVAIPAGEPLRRADLIRPDRIKRDDAITLVYEAPGILLACRGKALESGADGDVISVVNVQSKRTIQGTITGPGRVTVSTTTAQVAANNAPSTNASQ
jgi:flagella basal body P-ring formation protein FlgA